MRGVLAIALASSFLPVGCSTVPPPTAPAPTQVQTPVRTDFLQSSRPSPTPTIPSPSPAVSAAPDHYPPELLGRAFVLQTSEEGDSYVVGRLGLPGRLALPGGERVLGVVGDRVVSVRDAGSHSSLTLWSIGTGTPIFEPISLPGVSEPFGLVAGRYVILSPTRNPDGVVGAVIAMSTVDGSMRALIESAQVTGIPNPFRGVVVTPDGERVAMTVCSAAIDAVFGCRHTRVMDPATGDLLEVVDTDGEPVLAIWGKWLLTGNATRSTIVDRQGHVAWSTDELAKDTFLFQASSRSDGYLVARLRQFGTGSTKDLLLIDPSSGTSTVLLHAGDRDEWEYWPELSTDRLLALGPGGPACMAPYPCVGPKVLGAATFDPRTRTFTDHAIHLTIAN